MASGAGAGPLVPTFHGFVHNSMDGLILFEACLSGKLHHVPRRPHDRERTALIKSGSIFIYEENASGIKRWTDGVAWSPSRILGNFLIYRELEKPFPPGEKKRAMKRKRTSLPGEPYPRRDSDENADTSELQTPLTPPEPTNGEVKSDVPSTDHEKEVERSLIGSLVDSYGFRPDGLVKKTMSISVNGISHHMVSYYKVEDVKNRMLPRPMSDPRLANISVRPELYLKQNFRAPVEETEHYAVDGHMNAHPQIMYSAMPNAYPGVRPGQYFGQQYPGMYTMAPAAAGVYAGAAGTAWQGQAAPAGAMHYPGQSPYGASQPYAAYYRPNPDQDGSPAVKSEAQHGATPAQMQYGAQYATPYPNMQRNGSQSTPSMVQSAYQTPVQPSQPGFAPMAANGARPSYPGSNVHSPAPDQQHQQQVYANGTAQHYAVRSPPQNYGMQNGQPQNAISQSPHPSVKSPPPPHPGTPSQAVVADANGQMHNPAMPYRSGSYSVPHTPQSAHPNGDMNGLGISGAAAYPPQQSQPTHSYGYGHAGPTFRSGPPQVQAAGQYAS